MAADDNGPGAELETLRAELIQFVLQQAGAAIAKNPDLPLNVALLSALDSAVREGVAQAASARVQIDADAFVAKVSDRLIDHLARRGVDVAPSTPPQPSPGGPLAEVTPRLMVLCGVIVAALIAAFAAGWFGHQVAQRKVLEDFNAIQSASPVIDPPANEVQAPNNATGPTLGPAPGQVLNGVTPHPTGAAAHHDAPPRAAE